jgi:AbrB family looped-hinge helix DNA binding protein
MALMGRSRLGGSIGCRERKHVLALDKRRYAVLLSGKTWRWAMPTVKLSSKGQIAIPKPIRDGLGLKKDMVLEVSVDRSLIILKPLTGDDWLGLEGCLKGTRVLEDLEADHRKEIENGD